MILERSYLAVRCGGQTRIRSGIAPLGCLLSNQCQLGGSLAANVSPKLAVIPLPQTPKFRRWPPDNQRHSVLDNLRLVDWAAVRSNSSTDTCAPY
jgi:hypothetical protein